MHSALLNFYYRLPVFTRSTAASLRGLYLRSWRYGPETERLVAEALEREHWSDTQWSAWQEERLSFVLHRAATRVPYYRNVWAERRRHGDKSSWEHLENWQVLDKEALRKNSEAFVADDCDTGRMFHLATSGTTGKSISMWHSRAVMQAWYALFEARWRRWHGVTRHDRWAMLGGQLITPVQQRRPPFWVWNAPLNQLYMSTYHLASDLLPHYLDALQRYRIKYLWGYTSSLFELAQAALRLNRRDLEMTLAVTNAEPVFDHQRQAITEAFQCPVRETYGMSEMAAAAGECQSGTMHLWPEVGKLEVISDIEDAALWPGLSGRLVSTSLLNADMPLIRYETGDRGRLAASHRICGCGRRLPAIESVDGRTADLLYTADGRPIYWLNPIFYGTAVVEAQIVQEALDQVRIRYVPAPDYSSTTGQLLIRRLKDRIGEVNVSLEQVDTIPRGANGKFRAVVCNLPDEVRASLGRNGHSSIQ